MIVKMLPPASYSPKTIYTENALPVNWIIELFFPEPIPNYPSTFYESNTIGIREMNHTICLSDLPGSQSTMWLYFLKGNTEIAKSV